MGGTVAFREKRSWVRPPVRDNPIVGFIVSTFHSWGSAMVWEMLCGILWANAFKLKAHSTDTGIDPSTHADYTPCIGGLYQQDQLMRYVILHNHPSSAVECTAVGSKYLGQSTKALSCYSWPFKLLDNDRSG